MEKKIIFRAGEITANETAVVCKSNEPFAIYTLNINDFAGVHIKEEKYLKHGDWNYAFRCGGIGLVLMIICFAIAYGIKGSSTVSTAFLWLGIICAQLITFGALILILGFWDGLFGSTISNKLLLKVFGKDITKVIIASKTNEHIEFFMDKKTEQEKINEVQGLNTLKR